MGEAELGEVFRRQQAQLARGLALAQRLGAIGLGAHGVGAIGIGRGVAGIEGDGAPIGVDRFPHAAELAQHLADIVVQVGVVGRALGGAAQEIQRHVGPSRLPRHQAQEVQRLAMTGIAPEHLAIEALGLRQASLAVVRHPSRRRSANAASAAGSELMPVVIGIGGRAIKGRAHPATHHRRHISPSAASKWRAKPGSSQSTELCMRPRKPARRAARWPRSLASATAFSI